MINPTATMEVLVAIAIVEPLVPGFAPELELELKLGPEFKIEDVEYWDSGEADIPGGDEDDVPGDDEDDDVIDCAVPSFDPMENRL